ncbi:hypothetical protein PAMP_018838 [Pampus punctatissimus]
MTQHMIMSCESGLHTARHAITESDSAADKIRTVAGQHCGHILQAQTLDSQWCEGLCCHKRHCVSPEGKRLKPPYHCCGSSQRRCDALVQDHKRVSVACSADRKTEEEERQRK